jgi:hypothetical protein
MDLEKLASEVNRERGIKAVVLENYPAIKAARQHLWRWREITEAIKEGKPERAHYTAAAVSKAYRRVDVLVNAGKLKPVSGGSLKTGARSVPTSPSKASKPVVADDYGGFDRPKPKFVFDDDK